ncbi:MAG: hypothetical protein H7210_10110 [Pyrinomonadaceae bacterium]|nr:hypothetical protein [Phycisphaerales bacterium]
MLHRTLVLGFSVVAATMAPPASRADHTHQFFFRAPITSVEGTAPFNINVGDQLYAQYTFESGVPDTDPFPGVGVYPGLRNSYFSVDGTNLSDLVGPITVMDNTARGDVYRVAFTDAAQDVNISIELIDAESGAVDSDAIMTTLDLNLYTGKFDVAQIVIEAPSPAPAPPGSTYRLVATIESIKTYAVFCRCDWNQDDHVNSQDFFDFMADFFSGGGDYIPDGVHNTQDVFDFLTCFFNPAPHCP